MAHTYRNAGSRPKKATKVKKETDKTKTIMWLAATMIIYVCICRTLEDGERVLYMGIIENLRISDITCITTQKVVQQEQ